MAVRARSRTRSTAAGRTHEAREALTGTDPRLKGQKHQGHRQCWAKSSDPSSVAGCPAVRHLASLCLSGSVSSEVTGRPLLALIHSQHPRPSCVREASALLPHSFCWWSYLTSDAPSKDLPQSNNVAGDNSRDLLTDTGHVSQCKGATRWQQRE